MAAEGIDVKPSTDPSKLPVATDLASDGKYYQLEQPAFGPDAGAKVMVDDATGKRLPVGGAALGEPADASAAADNSTTRLIALVKRSLAHLTTLHTRTGDRTETAPASDTASSGLNGRLQRIAQRLTTIFGSTGDTADAVIAQGATGTIQAKLRALSALNVGATTTAIASTAADVQVIAATTSLRLRGFSFKENAGSTASLVLRNGTTATDPPLAYVTLGPNESIRDYFGSEGIIAAAGVYLDMISGTVIGNTLTAVVA